MRGLEGRAVLVTGGAGGIGSATCRRFAEEGAKVAVVDVDAERTAAVADGIAAAGGTAVPVIADLTDADVAREAVRTAGQALGGLDVVASTVGWDRFTPFLDSGPDHWRRIIDVNLMSVLHVLHAALPAMREQGAGRVVLVSSDAARVGSSGESVYSACKAGLIALAKTLAREHARDGITFNVVCPGLTETAMFDQFVVGAANPEKLREAYRRAVPMGRLGRADDIPGAIVFLASADAAFITGQVLSVSGGLTMCG